MTLVDENASLYNGSYFRHNCGAVYERSEHWLQFFGRIADNIVRKIGPRTVLDAGCGMGFLVEALRERGVEAFGLDISEYAIQRVREDLAPYCWVGSVLDPLPRRYDLIVCIEVLEHLPRKESEQAVESLCGASDDILFSSTPIDYHETTHFNVQPPEYWAGQFAGHDFVRDVDFDASFVTPWGVRFRRRREPWERVIRDYERRFRLLWKENQDLRRLALEHRTAVEEKKQMEARLEEIAGSPSWKLARRLRLGLAPIGSRRERLLDRALRSLTRTQKL